MLILRQSGNLSVVANVFLKRLKVTGNGTFHSTRLSLVKVYLFKYMLYYLINCSSKK